MSPEEHVTAIAGFGFTRRQARFLDIVIRHAGVCLLRQYATFAGIVPGQKTRAFFAKLVTRGYASSHTCRHNRGRIYHVHHNALYRAIEDPNNRYRRAVSARQATERLMALDALSATPDITWLAAGKEVRDHFTSTLASASDTVPTDAGPRWPGGEALCGDALRIGLDPAGRTVLLWVIVQSGRQDFRTCLARLAPLLSVIPAWTLRLVFPRALAQAYEDYQRVVREEWETPLHPRTIDRLNWYFDQRRKLPQGHSPFPADARYEDAALAFDGPRFDRLYQCWLRNGAASLNDATSRVIGEALASGSGRVECLILNHAYEHLSPVIDTRGCVVAAANDLDNLTTPRSANLGSSVLHVSFFLDLVASDTHGILDGNTADPLINPAVSPHGTGAVSRSRISATLIASPGYRRWITARGAEKGAEKWERRGEQTGAPSRPP